ncbi:MAG: flagellar motor switch protein FliG [Nitrospinaceae bacterium]|nr:flagellar motor switch protein FliG [Nitrospinaceae bacterium]NIR57703.1 flagellar motor switch protein FliG [Nitrospinaceae bacterium]NIS88167.1 flagellar motor switch protein FliG [Nitrospinaceae bacterium]NIT85045.1 flagellar motor switch protein FliG [Nitrospinaceae bacterium]NIU47207.1 flagellar motor switch protein FliG [Nitrospinaceae bacterium]
MAEKTTYSGPEKAAILLMSLGEQGAAKIFAEMEEREIQSIGNYMSTIGEVELGAVDDVTREFYQSISAGGSGFGISGLDFLKSTLMRALDPHKATEILNNITTPGEDLGGGLDTVRMLEPKVIANFLANEHPQTAAIVLAHLEPSIAGATLRELPDDSRMEVVYRLATLERVSPQVLRDLDEALQFEFRSSGAVSGSKMGGVTAAAQIMGTIDRATESSILSSMDEVDPDLANEIRNLRFTFEDILKLDDQGVQMVLKEISQEDLLISLKTASDELKDIIFSNMSERASTMLKEDLEALGLTKISDVERAQQKIVSAVKRLEDEGRLMVGGGAGEELV